MKSLHEYIIESVNKIDWTAVADKVFPSKDRNELIKELNIPSDVKIMVDGKTARKAPLGKWMRITIDPFYTDPAFIALDMTARWDTTDDANIWFDKLGGTLHRGFVCLKNEDFKGAYPAGLLVEINRGSGAMSSCNFIRLILDFTNEQVFNVVKEMYPKIKSVQEIY